MLDIVEPFDLSRMFVGDAPQMFYLEIVARTLIIYIYTLVLLRWIGGRTISQLSTVEFLLVIALGSAVGDALFYPDVPLLHAMLVITLVVLINKGIDMLLYRSGRMKTAIDGQAAEVIRDGRIAHEGLANRNMAVSELHEMLRLEGVSNLGEVTHAYIEPGGRMSVFRRLQKQPGLPIVPPIHNRGDSRCVTPDAMDADKAYACGHCGASDQPPPMTRDGLCRHCRNSEWIEATVGPALVPTANQP